MLYFAYGSNMSRGPMQQRCPDAKEFGRATLPDHRFAIMENGYATAVAAPGEDVQGILWRIGPRDLVALDEYEEMASGLYSRATLRVFHRHAPVDALVYLGCESREGAPSQAYMALVVDAARDCGLPEDYIAALAAIAPEAI